ncbi:uncharacterized protein LOC118750799 [Rhagoletis pomonella]|uniref:uncharacterized protein LOC118750799 n=1 Tax=Rhagoletis pomonella TaxID=28610 RepID=UPI00177DB011|nr:uncharacterized protein LOC118750799 [Rhagoletis pomonella]
MSGQFNGVQKYVQEEYPFACYVHCSAHVLNLAISKASVIPPIRHTLAIVKKLYTFFNTPKSKPVILSCLEAADIAPSVKSLKRLSVTRWTSKYNAVSDFISLMPFVHAALGDIGEWNDGSSTDAIIFQRSLDFEFIITINIIVDMFSYILPLCNKLQQIQIDLALVVDLANYLVAQLRRIRSREHYFEKLFRTCKKYANDMDIEFKKNRYKSSQNLQQHLSQRMHREPCTLTAYTRNVFTR